jgi:hypothetical protein
MQKLLCFVFLFLFIPYSNAQSLARKTYTIQYTANTPKIDGLLDEALWNEAQTATQFTQTIPSPDQPSNFATEVKMLYGSKAIYVGATMYQKKKDLSKLLTARDETNNINADVFSVFFDTYDDHQNGYAFRVTASGVQQDERLSGGDQYGDVSWDAVWISKVKINDDSWCVEMEIPFSAIRFTPDDQMKWGVNFLRLQRKKNENSYWNPINVQQSGFLAQTALLDGFKKIEAPVRLFLFPYLSLGYSENPYADKLSKQWLRSGGMDLKYGLSESFTLDLTLVPDFSQVISDNLVRNLSPFEQQLSENRPFFTEGVDLFSKADLFYSRRIGSRPNGYYDVEDTYGDTAHYTIQKNPNVSTLYNAFKITGRTANNSGIGIFNSLAKPMYAIVNDKINNKNLRVETAPLTNYNILVFDKPLKGQSYIHFANTNVLRMGSARDANVSALTFNLYDKKEAHVFSGYAKASVVHNKQLDAGTSFGLNYQKVSGKFRYGILANTMSALFDKTDLGLQFDFNRTSQNIGLSYNENKPKQAFLQLYEISSNHDFQWNTLPFEFRSYQANANLFLLFKNFWDVSLSFETKPFAPVDFYQLGSFDKKLLYLPYFYSALGGSSDSRKKLFWNYYAGYGFSNIKNADYININQGIRYQFSQSLEAGISGSFTFDESNIGYALFDQTLNEPIVGRRNVTEYEGQINIKYNFSPTMNVTARFRHYNSFINYTSFHRVEAGGAWQNSSYPFQANFNENYNVQNVDLFFNWMFRPGSRMVLSYKQWLGNEYLLNDQLENNYAKNVYQIIKSPHAFELSARIIFFIDYSKLKKK